jgi:SAM-dependent methyltransferase
MFKIKDFILQVLKGKTIYRVFFNWLVMENTYYLKGEVLDLAGGGNASYYKYLPKDLKIIKTNLKDSDGFFVDLNKKLNFENNSIENIFLFNAIYILENRLSTLQEIKRVLKPGGKFFLTYPFIANEMPEPHDYCRLTYEGIERELNDVNFSSVKIIRFGERFTSAAYLIHPLFFFNFLRLINYTLAIFLDKLMPNKIKKNYPTPLGYFCVIEK